MRILHPDNRETRKARLIVVTFVLASMACSAGASVGNLRCEYLNDPQGITPAHLNAPTSSSTRSMRSPSIRSVRRARCGLWLWVKSEVKTRELQQNGGIG